MFDEHLMNTPLRYTISAHCQLDQALLRDADISKWIEWFRVLADLCLGPHSSPK